MKSAIFYLLACFLYEVLSQEFIFDNGCTKNGIQFKEGEKYRHNRLRYQCMNGIMNILGCFDDSGKEIEAGEDFRDKDNLKYHCYRKGPIVGYTYIPEPYSATSLETIVNPSVKLGNCFKNGDSVKEGEEYRHNHLRYRCQNDIMHILGCYDDNGKIVEVGENFFDKSNLRYHCYREGTTVGFTYLPTISGLAVTSSQTGDTTCLHYSGTYKEGEEFKHNYLRWRCENGIMYIKGCYDGNNQNVEVGEDFKDAQQYTFHCYQKEKRIGYYWVPNRV
uniref:Abnormal cell migration protein 18-like fibronectin type I domain-containing protein n=1 Tax=Acrobeloides nanus TaxID=290746 RepID=A0A914E722_9BILA